MREPLVSAKKTGFCFLKENEGQVVQVIFERALRKDKKVGLFINIRIMSVNDASDNIDNFLGNIGCMVGNSFQVP